jgi:hypothetical protein
MVNQEVYISVLRCMHEALHRRHPDLWASGQWNLLNDNARPHTARSVSRFLIKQNVTVLPHPPYLPDLSLCDFFLFPWLKKRLKVWRGYSSGCDDGAHSIPKEAFSSCFQDLQKRWQQCIGCGGNYFKGDSCKVEFCIFYRLRLITLRTKDVILPQNMA